MSVGFGVDWEGGAGGSGSGGAVLGSSIVLIESGGVLGDDTVTITAPVLSASYVLVLPTDDGTSGQVLQTDGSGNLSWLSITLDHGSLTGLADDDHTQYTLLAGRSGGQSLKGGTGAGELLTLNGTSHAAGGDVAVGGGTAASGLRFLEPSGSGTHYTMLKAQAQTGNVVYTLPAADATVSGYALKSDAAGTLSWGPAGGVEMKQAVTQVSHGFVVGDVLYLNSGTYTKADADAAATAEVVGIVQAVTSADVFVILYGGVIDTLSGLTAGTVYFLSGTAGAYTSTEPSSVGQISKPLMIASSTTAAYFFNMRGATVGSPASSFTIDRFSGDGSDTTFDLSVTPQHENNTQVFISGVYQQKDTYSLSGTTITFSAAPPTGTDNIEVCTVGALSIGTPSDGTVTWAKLSNVPVMGTTQAATSGTAIDFTGIPSGVKKITISWSGLSTNGTSIIIVQLGDADGFEVTGYLGAVGLVIVTDSLAVQLSTGFMISADNAATNLHNGSMELTLLNAATFLWACSASDGTSESARAYSTGGSKALSAALTQVRVTTVSAGNSFDAGSINIQYI